MVGLGAITHAATPDPAPILATDAQGATTLTGGHHLNGAALSLIVTDWWLSGTIAQGQAQDVRLIVEVHLPQYPLLDRATDAAGHKLDVVILRRGPSSRWRKKASERVAVVLPHDYAEQARATGLDITVSGKDRSFPIKVPADALAHFLDSYAQAETSTGAAPQSTPEPAASPPAATTPPPDEAPAAPPAAARALPSSPPSPPAIFPKAPVPAPPAAPPPSASPPANEAASPSSTPGFPPPAPPPGTKLHSLPGMEAAPAPSDADSDSVKAPASPAGSTTTITSLGLEFAATSSGAMILTVQPGSKAEKLGLASGDFIEGVDGHPIKDLSATQMAAKIGDPAAKILNCIAAGDVKLR